MVSLKNLTNFMGISPAGVVDDPSSALAFAVRGFAQARLSLIRETRRPPPTVAYTFLPCCGEHLERLSGSTCVLSDGLSVHFDRDNDVLFASR